MNDQLVGNLTLILVALITAGSAILVAFLGKKITEIHVMVNSNLAEARNDREKAVAALAEVNKTNAERMSQRIDHLLEKNEELHKELVQTKIAK